MALFKNGNTIFLYYYSYLIILIFMFFSVTYSIDTMILGRSLLARQTLDSNTGMFTLGFFSPGNSGNYYVGIWYKEDPNSVVWVLNRYNPIPSSSYYDSSLELSDGMLAIGFDSNSTWTTFWEMSATNATGAILLDNGNFVLRGASGEVLWQSFDYPTDTWLPGGRIGVDQNNNRSFGLNSWRNSEDPGPGLYSLALDPIDQRLFVMRNLTTIYVPGIEAESSPFSNYSYVSIADVNYFTYTSVDSVPTRITVNSFGSTQCLIYLPNALEWTIVTTILGGDDLCAGAYDVCGPFGVCSAYEDPICSCLYGFVPQFQMDWNRSDFSGGCVRSKPLLCNNKDRFLRLPYVDPDHSLSLKVFNETRCEFLCSINCSCNAYFFDNATGERECSLWTGDLSRSIWTGYEGSFYLKLNQDEIANEQQTLPKKKNYHSRKKMILSVTISVSVSLLLVITGFLCLLRVKLKRTEARNKQRDLLLLNMNNNSKQNPSINEKSGKEQEELELPKFSFSSISNATENFSAANKLGEGGFGPVYKGSLHNGQSVAVKRLAKLSKQGMEELRNEAILIAKLQHKNLVKLLGYCIEKDERILIYEYMPNKSLDSFLFDPTKRLLLNWSGRVSIIDGIVQGLLYLHEYSRLRVVHRDLKAGNILLDADMNPKISDFGMARIFEANDLHVSTHRVVGTYGYMSPEYAMRGHFSIKSDVFAFGVLLLEILSGKKNKDFRNSDFLGLLGYAWDLWENERVMELIDPVLEIPTSSSTIALRYIVVGLLCVQENPGDRPTMFDVLSMLSNEQTTLASPKKPGFIVEKTLVFVNPDIVEAENGSVNYLTTSAIEAR